MPIGTLDRTSVEFFEKETARLYEMYQRRVEQYYTPIHVNCTKNEWAESLMESTMEFAGEIEVIEPGTYVIVKGVNTANCVVKYGIVIHNHNRFEIEQDVYRGWTAQPSPTAPVCVSWKDAKHNQICIGFHDVDQLEVVPS